MMRFLFLRFFTPLWILSFGLGSFPAHALRPMSDQSGLEEKLHSASGLEAVGRSRPEDDGVETPGRERGESGFFRNLEMDLPEEWRKKLAQRRGPNNRSFSHAKPIPTVAGPIPAQVSAETETFQPQSPLLLLGERSVPENELERRKRFVAWAEKEEKIKFNTYQEYLGRVVERHLPLVTSEAGKVAKTIPWTVDRGDLLSAGSVGFLEAASHYDPIQGTKFDVYVAHRIRGAILDELRQMDSEERTVRGLVNKLEKEEETGFSVEETAVAWKVDPNTARRALEVIRRGDPLSLKEILDSKGEGKRGEAVFPDKSVLDPSEEAERDDLLHFMTRELTPREKVILILQYPEGLTNREIGDVLGVSASRVAQIGSSLHKKMGQWVEQFREGKTLMRLDSLGSRLRYARLALGLSLQKVGKKAGIRADVLEHYESSESHLGEKNLGKLSVAYQVLPEWLLKGESPPEFLVERYLVEGREEVRRIEEERGRKGVPPDRLAKQAGVVREVYSFYVRGEVVPAPPVLGRLRQAIETSAQWYQPPRYIKKQYLLPKGGLEEKVSNTLAALAQTAQRRPGVLVIEAPVLSRRAGLEEFAARVPRELGRKILLYAEEESLAARETAARSGIRFVRDGMEELAAALIGLEEADQVGFLGDPGKAKLLSQVLPASMAVTPLDPGTGLEELLLLLGMPRQWLPELDATGLEEDLARQRAA